MIVRAYAYLKAHSGPFVAVLTLAWTISQPIPALGQSQWTGSSPGPIYYNGGSVGIGTANPSEKLEVLGSQAFNIPAQGTGDIHLTSNAGGLRFFATTALTGSPSGAAIQFWGNSSQFPGQVYLDAGAIDTGALIFRTALSAGTITERMRLSSSGKFGIGTANPQYLLSVNGTIGAKDVIVTNTGWYPDYVFLPDYRLQSLSEVNAYIQANHHLPDIPSEAEVKEKGVSVGEMQSKLLAKIEELTLHMIQQDDRGNRLEQQNQGLRDQITRLERAFAPERP